MNPRFLSFLPSRYSPVGRVLYFTGSVYCFIAAAVIGLTGQACKGTGWAFVGLAIVAGVILLAACAFVAVSLAAIVAALVMALWALASRLFEFGRLFLRWAAV